MKKFFIKISLFSILGFFVLNIFVQAIFLSDPFCMIQSWGYIYKQILKSEQKIESEILYLGDSVANQIYPANQNENSLSCTGAISVAGHYILAHKTLENNPNIKKVVLASVPNVLGYYFEEFQTYNNFVEPFFTYDNLDLLSESIYDKMDEKPESYFSILPVVKVSGMFSDVNFQKGELRNLRTELSDIAIEYLKKLETLCDEKNVELVIVSPPVRKSRIKATNNWEKLRAQIKKENLEDLFKGYFEGIRYIDDVHFMDFNHLKLGYLKKERVNILNHMLDTHLDMSKLSTKSNKNELESKLKIYQGKIKKLDDRNILSVDFSQKNKTAWGLKKVNKQLDSVVVIKANLEANKALNSFILLGMDNKWTDLIQVGVLSEKGLSVIRTFSKSFELKPSYYKIKDKLKTEMKVVVDFRKNTINLYLDNLLTNTSKFNSSFKNISYIGILSRNEQLTFDDISIENFPKNN